jgi:hypothetical protein
MGIMEKMISLLSGIGMVVKEVLILDGIKIGHYKTSNPLRMCLHLLPKVI